MNSSRVIVTGNRGGGYDTDVSNYSLSEVLDLVGLSGAERISEVELSDIIQGFVDKYREADIALSRFFSDVGLRLYSLLLSGGDGEDGGVKDSGNIREGLANRSTLARGGNNSAGGGGAFDRSENAEVAEGAAYDDNLGGVGDEGYGDEVEEGEEGEEG